MVHSILIRFLTAHIGITGRAGTIHRYIDVSRYLAWRYAYRYLLCCIDILTIFCLAKFVGYCFISFHSSFEFICSPLTGSLACMFGLHFIQPMTPMNLDLSKAWQCLLIIGCSIDQHCPRHFPFLRYCSLGSNSRYWHSAIDKVAC